MLPSSRVAPAERRALRLVKRHGWNATSFQTLEPGFCHWFDVDGLVAYAQLPRAVVVAGAPMARAGRLAEVAGRFEAHAAARAQRVCYFGVEERFLSRHRLSSLLVGEQPVWDPRRWSESVARSRSLRTQLRRARNKGVNVRRVPDAELIAGPLRSAVDRLAAAWLASRRMAPMGFLVDLQLYGNASLRRYFVAERGGELLAQLAAVPVYARRGWLFEDVLRSPEAPNGTHELLVDFAMCSLGDEGSAYVTLGLVPLAGEVSTALRQLRSLLRPLYDFEGVQRFRARLRPQRWDRIFLACPPSHNVLLALSDVLTVFARGSKARFGRDTAQHAWRRAFGHRLAHPSASIG
jgi:lysylphosphatidylglycerol synthetase-like protein (DUF2156 family)